MVHGITGIQLKRLDLANSFLWVLSPISIIRHIGTADQYGMVGRVGRLSRLLRIFFVLLLFCAIESCITDRSPQQSLIAVMLLLPQIELMLGAFVDEGFQRGEVVRVFNLADQKGRLAFLQTVQLFFVIIAITIILLSMLTIADNFLTVRFHDIEELEQLLLSFGQVERVVHIAFLASLKQDCF